MKKIKTRDTRNLKIVKNNSTTRITIPKGWRKILDLKENTELEVQLVEKENGEYGVYIEKPENK